MKSPFITITHYIIQAGFDFILFVVRNIYAIIYWRKGKSVPPIQNSVLLKSATSLACEIREGQLKSVDVIQAYIERIKEVEPFINATVDRRFKEALEEAQQVDILVASEKYTKKQLAEQKPLLGVPFSVKVLLKVKGCRSTAGSLLFKDMVALDDSPSVRMMKDAGAIVIATTNIPEFGAFIEANNILHGKTCNPYDTNRTCGGSSGGEGAMIGAGGSVIGLGNDLGGSIRIPSHFNGIFAHLPTVGLVSNRGCFPNIEFLGDYVFTGPMCRYAEDLITLMKVLSCPIGNLMKFDKQVDFRRLKICYLTHITCPLLAAVDREIIQGLKKAVSHFQTTYGVEAKEIHLPILYDANRMVANRLIDRAGKKIKSSITHGKGDNIDVVQDFIKLLFGKSRFSFPALIVFNMINNPVIYQKKNSPHYKEKVEKLRKELNCLLDENTVLMMPTFPVTAPYHYQGLVYFSVVYTAIFNYLGIPITQCPIGFDRVGLPYGIQLIARKYNDPLTIACGIELEKAFQGWVPPSLA